MVHDDALTIFLPLRGRHLLTLRWLWHADRTRLSYRVIVADGDVHPTIDRLLSDPLTFPHLRFEYHRHADRSFSDFYAKCATSLDRVGTRYTMIADNDDFLLPTGIEKCIAFLDGHPAFVCALGGIPGFFTKPSGDCWQGALGPTSKIRYRCHDDGSYDPRDFDQPEAADRVVAELRHFLSVYYGVYRTPVLRTIMQELKALDFSDLVIHEYYAALRAMTLGKVRADRRIMSYIRQGNTSSGFSYATDWVDHFLKSRFPQDFRALAHDIAAHSGCSDGEATARLESEIHREFAAILRRTLAATVLRHRFPRLFLIKQKLVRLRATMSVPRSWRVAAQKRNLWRRLAADGATPETMAGHRKELAAIDRTLNGQEFADFVRRSAPDLVEPACR